MTIHKKKATKKSKRNPKGKKKQTKTYSGKKTVGNAGKKGIVKRKSSGKSRKTHSSKKKWRRGGKKEVRGSFLQMLCLMIVLSASIALLKHYFLDVSMEQAKRIRAAEEATAGKDGILEREEKNLGRPAITQDFLTPNSYSRSGIEIGKVKGIVVHYVANPGSTAKENRDYFEGLKDTHVTKASSHYVIGIKGEIIQCIPLGEISYASNDRNHDTISIECCHPGSDGKFSQETYASLLDLVCWLCDTYGLKPKDVIRHYDVTGKECPLYFVRHPDKWEKFKQDIDYRLKQ